MHKVYIKTLGCEKNTVDSEGIAGLLQLNGIKLVDSPDKADVFIVNTCGFILDAKIQSIDTIFELAALKDDKKKLIVCGCLAQRYADELALEMPEADAFVGVDDYKNLISIINGNEKERVFVGHCAKEFNELPRKINKSHTACLKISEGCANVCSYCAIPLMKGRYRSRQEKDIIEEAKRLAAAGVKELVIIAQDTTYYGRDLKVKSSLPKLLKKLCKIDGIEWIRLMYCYEDEITDELIECIKTEKKICKYIDMPIQHCNNDVLKAMNRKSTHKSILKTISKLRKEIPDICLRTTLMVGFPGEKKKEFDELLDFVKEVKFDRLGVFPYSKEEGTKAYSMAGQVRKDVKERRVDAIMETQRFISLHHNEELVGKTLQVIIDDIESDGIYVGRSYMDAPDIDNGIMVKSEKKLKIGSLVNVRILDAFDYDLTGEKVK